MPERHASPVEERNVIKIPLRRVMDFLYIVLVAFVLLIVYLTYPQPLGTDAEVWQAAKPTTTQPFIRIRTTREKSTGQYTYPVTISVKDADETIWTFHVSGCAPSDITADHTTADGETAGWVTFKRASRDEISADDKW